MAYDIEKKSLEAHVEICAVRYENLETQLSNLETRMDKFENYLLEIKNTLVAVATPKQSESKGEDSGPYKTMIAVGTTMFGALIGVIATLIVHVK